MVNDGQINPMAVFKSPRAGQFGAPDAVPARESSDDVHGLQRYCGAAWSDGGVPNMGGLRIPSIYSYIHRIGWWENLQESPIFDGKNHGFL